MVKVVFTPLEATIVRDALVFALTYEWDWDDKQEDILEAIVEELSGAH